MNESPPVEGSGELNMKVGVTDLVKKSTPSGFKCESCSRCFRSSKRLEYHWESKLCYSRSYVPHQNNEDYCDICNNLAGRASSSPQIPIKAVVYRGGLFLLQATSRQHWLLRFDQKDITKIEWSKWPDNYFNFETSGGSTHEIDIFRLECRTSSSFLHTLKIVIYRILSRCASRWS